MVDEMIPIWEKEPIPDDALLYMRVHKNQLDQMVTPFLEHLGTVLSPLMGCQPIGKSTPLPKNVEIEPEPRQTMLLFSLKLVLCERFPIKQLNTRP